MDAKRETHFDWPSRAGGCRSLMSNAHNNITGTHSALRLDGFTPARESGLCHAVKGNDIFFGSGIRRSNQPSTGYSPKISMPRIRN